MTKFRQASDSLAAESWQDIGAAQPGSGGTLQFTPPNAAGGKWFYRISIRRI